MRKSEEKGKEGGERKGKQGTEETGEHFPRNKFLVILIALLITSERMLDTDVTYCPCVLSTDVGQGA